MKRNKIKQTGESHFLFSWKTTTLPAVQSTFRSTFLSIRSKKSSIPFSFSLFLPPGATVNYAARVKEFKEQPDVIGKRGISKNRHYVEMRESTESRPVSAATKSFKENLPSAARNISCKSRWPILESTASSSSSFILARIRIFSRRRVQWA